jgi:MFS family permease
MGLYGSFEGVGSMIGPPIYGMIWSIFAPQWVFVAGAILQFMSILLVHLIKVKPETIFQSK